MIRAVIFDLDNTLYEYEPCHIAASVALNTQASTMLCIDEKDFIQAYEHSKKEVKRILSPHAACHNRLLYIENTLEYLGFAPALYALELYNSYWDTFLDKMQLFNWAIELFDKLKENKLKVILCSDLTAHIQYKKLNKLNIAKYFDYIVTSEEAIFDKPNPLIFQLCLEKVKLLASECLFIGDSIEKDIEGATKAGMQSVYVNNGYLDKIKLKQIIKL